MMLKEGGTREKVAQALLREYLISYHADISADFPEVAGIEPANAADFLIHLQNTGRIKIKLFNLSATRVGCRIIEADAVEE